ncbi:hypothetical protein DGWBC_0614 [Dehalogenimonas sp. WBC-2]|nr:hypothetical protein DGWBC_0614 [Dehalogenimonas sp. WBC-2]
MTTGAEIRRVINVPIKLPAPIISPVKNPGVAVPVKTREVVK